MYAVCVCVFVLQLNSRAFDARAQILRCGRPKFRNTRTHKGVVAHDVPNICAE